MARGLSAQQRRELWGVGLGALGLLLALALVPVGWLGAWGVATFPTGNIVGWAGRAVARGVWFLWGAAGVLVPALPWIGAGAAFGWLAPERARRTAVGVVGLLLLAPPLLGVLAGPAGLAAEAAGWWGRALGALATAAFGRVGASIVVACGIAAWCIAVWGWNPLRAIAHGARRLHAWRPAVRWPRRGAGSRPAGSTVADLGASEPDPAVAAAAPTVERRSPRRRDREALAAPEPAEANEPDAPAGADLLPPTTLLTPPPPRDERRSRAELDALGQRLLDKLAHFHIRGDLVGMTVGPVVTQFEIAPAPGVKVSRIASLDADLALALHAPSVRIVAPIPGKGAIGVEVPNPEPEIVYFREILESAAFRQSRAQLPLALGKDIAGQPYVADLARMPHLLIAGATGSGKSVCINTIITSLIYRHTPRTLRLLLVDPKMVELSMYNDLPHLRHPVVTDPHDASGVLRWAVLEMERRYALLSANNVRNIQDFNRRVAAGQPLRRAEPDGPEGDPDRWLYRDGPLPYIVLIIDELADLMMTVQAEVERPLALLAQKARAIGIHLILATQRPSVNVITGLIKANFPSRIAFRVSSKVDSRTILDQNGADALLGNGDMLLLPPGTSEPVRLQGAYLSTEETERLVEWYRERVREERAVREPNILDEVRALEPSETAVEGAGAPEERDRLFREAAELCIQHRGGSTSLLQRKLKIGYGRAARIIDQLHAAGVLGPPDGSKPREVLIGLDELDRICPR